MEAILVVASCLTLCFGSFYLGRIRGRTEMYRALVYFGLKVRDVMARPEPPPKNEKFS